MVKSGLLFIYQIVCFGQMFPGISYYENFEMKTGVNLHWPSPVDRVRAEMSIRPTSFTSLYRLYTCVQQPYTMFRSVLNAYTVHTY